jgi:hypothetical protein
VRAANFRCIGKESNCIGERDLVFGLDDLLNDYLGPPRADELTATRRPAIRRTTTRSGEIAALAANAGLSPLQRAEHACRAEAAESGDTTPADATIPARFALDPSAAD